MTQVQVQITDSRTSPVLLHRMEESMKVVAEQLFNGRDEAIIQVESGAYERLLAEISDRVITGYQTNDVRVTTENTASGTAARIRFSVSPWAQVVEDVRTDIQFSGISPVAARALQGRIPELDRQIREVLAGSSLDAADWAGGVLRSRVQNRVEQELPDFKAAVDLTGRDGTIQVQVIIYPVGELVREVKYSMLSRSLPNILLMELKYRYADKAKALRGLPLSYVRAERERLSRLLLEELAAEPQVRRHKLQPQVSILPGADTAVDVSLESDGYRIWFEGYGDIGRKDHNLSGKAHLGKFISRRDEVFGEAGVDLKDVDWDFGAGYALHHGKSAFSWLRRWPGDVNVWRAEYEFSPKWRLRYEHSDDTGVNEYAVRYRIHEFLSGEYVYSTDKSYFRVVGNL